MSEGQEALRDLLLIIYDGDCNSPEAIAEFFERFEVSITARQPLADDFHPKPKEEL